MQFWFKSEQNNVIKIMKKSSENGAEVDSLFFNFIENKLMSEVEHVDRCV